MSQNQCSIHGNCCGSAHSHSHGSCGEKCNCQCPCCQSQGHHHHEHKHEECHFSKELLEIADAAWMDVLSDKIKQRIATANGQSLDELAKIVVDANAERWKLKMAKQKNCHDYEEKVAQFFNKK